MVVELFETLFERLIFVIVSLLSVLQTLMVSTNVRKTPLDVCDRPTTQLFVRDIVGLVLIEHAPVPSDALQFAGVPSVPVVTVQGPPLNAAPQALPATVRAPWLG